ncbi:hypothetical protein HK098_003770 [Nowakowskiella sp. JEL0407]|nr:hypothetical protein HK098_003770 [Nowakowskiella sp. JEL0407]
MHPASTWNNYPPAPNTIMKPVPSWFPNVGQDSRGLGVFPQPNLPKFEKDSEKESPPKYQFDYPPIPSYVPPPPPQPQYVPDAAKTYDAKLNPTLKSPPAYTFPSKAQVAADKKLPIPTDLVNLNPFNNKTIIAAPNNSTSNQECDTLLQTLYYQEQQVCQYSNSTKNYDEAVENLAKNVAASCSDPKCYNYVPDNIPLIKSTCPDGYIGQVTSGNSSIAIKVSELVSIPSRTQSQLDRELPCYKEDGKYCLIEFLRGTYKANQTQICSQCTKNLMLASRNYSSSDSTLLAGFNETILSNCDLKFLAELGMTSRGYKISVSSVWIFSLVLGSLFL